MNRLLSLNIPGGDLLNPASSGRAVAVPSEIPKALQGGLAGGQGLFQVGYNFFFIVAILLGIVYLMWAGISYISSGGDSSKLQAAKKKLVFAVLGLIVVITAFVIVSIVIKVLGGDPRSSFLFKR